MTDHSSNSAGTTSSGEPDRMPRHRGDDNAPVHHWWRTDAAASSNPRRAKPDDEPGDQSLAGPGAGEAAARHRRSVVGPWIMLSPGGAAADWNSEPPAEAAEDAPTVPFMRIGAREERPLTQITDRDAASSRPAGKPDEPPTGAAAAATSFPAAVDTSERGLAAYARHTRILSGRQLRVVTRDRLTLLQSMLFPLLSMVMFKVVLGDAVGAATGQNSAYGTVPLVVLVGAMFGSLAVGTRLMGERQTGLLTRLYVLPVHRAADLTSRVGVEMIRILASTFVLTTAGMLIGWRFNQGVLPAIGIFAVALLYGAAYSTIVLTLSVSSSNLPLVPIMSLVTSLLMFFNSGFSPIDAYPEILQPLVRNQPMTCAIETMRALATGGPVAENLIKTIVWALVIIAIFAYPALRGYRRAAASRT